jgi:CHAD domain-containing protein
MFLQFEFPHDLTVEKFIGELNRQVDMQPVSSQVFGKTYYDSFDWRLYSNGLTCEFDQAKNGSILALRAIKTGAVIVKTKMAKVPLFSWEFEPETIRSSLAPVLEMRALLSICQLDCRIDCFNITNTDRKIILKLSIEQYKQLNSRVVLQPVKGYGKAVKQIAEILTSNLGLKTAEEPVLLKALRLQGRKPKDYSSKLSIDLDPAMRADIAGKYIYSHLLKTLKANEQGTIDAIDTEFLHDFRVAVRRTRAGLSQIKGVLPAETNAYYAGFFSWLGQITGPARDLDVYLLNFDSYKNSLPESIRDDLDPLYDFLLAKRQQAQKELVKKLKSGKYRSTLSEWEQFLKEPSFKLSLESNSRLAIKELADKRIWKIFNRVLKEGNAITESSPAESLHDLRKSCKKLRYLMEFFQCLYPERQIKQLIKNLKGLQEVLGDFQDYAVQESQLKLFGEEMMGSAVHANAFLAMGVLIQQLDVYRCAARNDFAAKFGDFKQEQNRSAFRALFVPSKPGD